MTSISPADLLVARLQAEIASSGLSLAKRKRTNDVGNGDGTNESAEARKHSAERLLERRIGTIESTDPDRRRKIFRAFLEVALLAEFGEHVINDPAFYRLVDEVHETMENDPLVRERIDLAVDTLERLG
ncbi:MAG: hypothetical protein QM639_02160 [Rhodocyclaceae bacterium]